MSAAPPRATLSALALAITLGVLPGTPAAAQRRPANAWDASRTVPGVLVRVRSGGIVREGRFKSATGSALLLTGEGDETAVPVSAIDSLWTRESRGPLGCAVGGATGILGGAALTALFIRALCDSPSGCASDYRSAVPVGALVIGFGGGLVGTAIGSFVHTWTLRLPIAGR